MSLQFVNVDLEIESKKPLKAIVAEFKDIDIEPLYNGESERSWLATFEVSSGGNDGNPDTVINRFIEIIERFEEEAKKEWGNAHAKVFDIGLEVTGEYSRFREELKPNTINLISKYGASVVFTVYPQEKA